MTNWQGSSDCIRFWVVYLFVRPCLLVFLKLNNSNYKRPQHYYLIKLEIRCGYKMWFPSLFISSKFCAKKPFQSTPIKAAPELPIFRGGGDLNTFIARERIAARSNPFPNRSFALCRGVEALYDLLT